MTTYRYDAPLSYDAGVDYNFAGLMPPYNITDSLDAIVSFIQANGYADAQVGDLKGPLSGPGIAAAVFVGGMTIFAVMADGGTRESHTVLVRFYRSSAEEPVADMEAGIAEAVSEFASAMLADADLGGEVVTVDPAGIGGESLSAEWGWIDVSGVMCRMADITVPLLVDNSATVTA